MRRKKILSLPALNDRGGDLNKEWYVEIGMRDPKVDKWERRRYSKLKEHGLNINKKTPVEERQKEAQKIIDILKDKIKKGWTIFDEEFEYYIYEDRLKIRFDVPIAVNKHAPQVCYRKTAKPGEHVMSCINRVKKLLPKYATNCSVSLGSLLTLSLSGSMLLHCHQQGKKITPQVCYRLLGKPGEPIIFIPFGKTYFLITMQI